MNRKASKKPPFGKVTTWFAEQMRRKLFTNRHLGSSWIDEDWDYLIERLNQETKELVEEIRHYDATAVAKTRIIEEAADVANFAMMIADNARGEDDDRS